MNRELATTEISFFHCPITKEKLRDPVVAEDGHTYERDAIVKWLQDENGTSPKTRKPLDINRLIPNLLVKQLIDEQFETTLRKQNYLFKLGDDIKQLDHLFVTFGKSIDAAEWIKKRDGPPIILMTITGARAQKEAMFYVNMSKHSHVVRTYGLVDNPDEEVMLVQERAQNGDLLQILKKRDRPPSEIVLREVFIQIADGMSFLAHNNIVHGDLACRNILVFNYDEQNPRQILVKVTDFGLSRASSIYKSVSTSTSTTLNVIPYRYTAPEILQNPDSKEFYTEKSDMYSMGVLMWEAYSLRGKQPWSHIQDDNIVMQMVIEGERLQQPPTCSEELWSLIQTTMLQQPDDRPTFSDLHRQLIELKIGIQASPVLSSNVKKALKDIKENSRAICLSETALSNEEMKLIAEELKTNETVHCLELCQNKLSNEGATVIAEMLEMNRTISEMMLSSNNISSDGAVRLALALTRNHTLATLDIGYNPLFDDGIQAICEALKKTKTLTKLFIHGTRISIIGVKSIAEMLRDKHLTLERLAIGSNNITDGGAELIAEALKINTSLTWLHMESPDITDKGVRALANAIKVHKRRFDYFYVIPDSPITDSARKAIKAALHVNAACN
jgi:serine/threonine protein kinase